MRYIQVKNEYWPISSNTATSVCQNKPISSNMAAPNDRGWVWGIRKVFI